VAQIKTYKLLVERIDIAKTDLDGFVAKSEDFGQLELTPLEVGKYISPDKMDSLTKLEQEYTLTLNKAQKQLKKMKECIMKIAKYRFRVAYNTFISNGRIQKQQAIDKDKATIAQLQDGIKKRKAAE